jgi:hypothetical protein
MGAPDLSKADFLALRQLAEAKFERWLKKKGLPERDRQLRDLKTQKLMFGGRVFHTQRIWEEFLVRKVRKRIGCYAEVAHESGNREVLSGERLGELRDRITTSVGIACKRLREDIEKDGRGSARDVSEAQLEAPLEPRNGR